MKQHTIADASGRRAAARITTSIRPAGQRRLWIHAAACPECAAVTPHRTVGPDPSGLIRKGACGHLYALGAGVVTLPRQRSAGVA